MKLEALFEAKRIETTRGYILSGIRKTNVPFIMTTWPAGIRGVSDAKGIDIGDALTYYHGNIMTATGNRANVLFIFGPTMNELDAMDHGNKVIFKTVSGWLLEVIEIETDDQTEMRNFMQPLIRTFGPLSVTYIAHNQLTLAFNELQEGDVLR